MVLHTASTPNRADIPDIREVISDFLIYTKLVRVYPMVKKK